MTLGTAIRLGQLIGLHRKRPDVDPNEEQMRRRLFWAIFLLDRCGVLLRVQGIWAECGAIYYSRYICVVLGLPSCINELDVTQDYPIAPGLTGVDPSNDTQDLEIPALSGCVAHIK
jgi:hypothetical protein